MQIGQEELQIEAALGILNWAKKITTRGRDYISGQEGFQIGAGIKNWCRTDSSCQFMNFEFDNFKTSLVITPTPERQYDALRSKIDM